MNKIINLNPVFLNDQVNGSWLNFNSVLFLILCIIEIFILLFIFYYFFKTELIFIYTNVIKKDYYTKQEKMFYNNYMLKIKNLTESKKYCELLTDSIYINDDLSIENKYFPLYNDKQFMKALNNDIIYFNSLESCNKFLGITNI